jgi:hypothetical protein
MHAGERFQTGSWCAGARDKLPRSTSVVLRELVTPYEAQFRGTPKPELGNENMSVLVHELVTSPGPGASISIAMNTRGNNMESLLFVVGFVALWIALQAWILPRFGVST